MLVLGHVGITVGAAMAGEAIMGGAHARDFLSQPCGALRRTAVSLSHRMDLRWLLLASLLPDIIDKPLGFVLYSSALGSGRLFSHTIWFAGAIVVAGVILRGSRSGAVFLALAFGSSMHLLLDSMWRAPVTLFWPLLGPFPHGSGPDEWLMTIIRHLFTRPESYVPEIAGAILILPLLVIVMGRTSPLLFLKTGRLAE